MSRSPIVLLLLLVTAACGSKKAYTFQGCEDAGEDCRGGGIWGCAQDRIASRFDACTADSDCALIAKTTIQCGTDADAVIRTCIASVRPENAGAYRGEVANEATRACGVEICHIAGAGCDADESTSVAACDVDAGRCIVIRNPDAGCCAM